MSKQAFIVEGEFQMGRVRQHFVLQVAETDEEAARRHVYTDLGSRHGVNRRQIDIQSVKAVSPDQVGPITRKRLQE